MGAGKTTVGRRLAERLGRVFADTDALVERAAGRSIERIILDSGEGPFRGLEEQALLALGRATGMVVATGGGLFLGARQRRHMKRIGTVLWLDVAPEQAARRVGAGFSRPLWNDRDPIDFRVGFDRRRAVYALAHARIDANRGVATVTEEAARIVLRLESRLG